MRLISKIGVRFFVLMLILISHRTYSMNCLRAVTPLENTVCTNETLRWLDTIIHQIYSLKLVQNSGKETPNRYSEWDKLRGNCTTETCLEHAYYEGIAHLSEASTHFSWTGKWRNTSTANMSGGELQISRDSEWGAHADFYIWAGMNNDEYAGEIQKIQGIGVVNSLINTHDCRLLMVPINERTLQIYSNGDMGCRMSMPTGAYLDGQYSSAEDEPTAKPSLLSIGIFTQATQDDQFRHLVGADYQHFVDTANTYVYSDNLDKNGATVISLWVHGASHTRSAIIMYTPDGDMWAACTQRDKKGQLTIRYYASNHNTTMPLTISSWKDNILGA